MTPPPAPAALGVVVIGRNEGDRLGRCLDAVPAGVPVVYVDSGSTDGSVARCRGRAVEVVELDLSTPFTAARARNAGAARLVARHPAVRAVQFVDGDCELAPGWLDRAWAELAARPEAAVVCGRLRERSPGASVYNRLCDMEWDTPTGDVAECGGIALMRAAAFTAAGGFRPELIAGEEPELCARLRAAGGAVVRLPDEMARHDAAMTRFGQWWRRAVRAGHAYAEVAARHGRGSLRSWRRQTRSNWFWAAGVPLLAGGAAAVSPWLGLPVLAGYPVLGLRVYRGRRRRGDSPADARLYAAFTVLAKFPLALGQARYHWSRAVGRAPRLIEHKRPEATAC